MAEFKESNSLYYRRLLGKTPPGVSNTRPRRVGDCGHTLAGRRGHGFVSQDGKTLTCSQGCLKKKRGVRQ